MAEKLQSLIQKSSVTISSRRKSLFLGPKGLVFLGRLTVYSFFGEIFGLFWEPDPQATRGRIAPVGQSWRAVFPVGCLLQDREIAKCSARMGSWFRTMLAHRLQGAENGLQAACCLKGVEESPQGIWTHETRPEAVRRGSVVFRRGCCPRCRPGSRPRGQEKKGTGPVAAFFYRTPPGVLKPVVT